MTLSPDALLEWVPVACGQRVRCDCCGLELKPNDRLEALVTADGFDVELVARRCQHCARSEIRPETERDCVLVSGVLAASIDGRGRSQVVLSGATVVDRTDD